MAEQVTGDRQDTAYWRNKVRELENSQEAQSREEMINRRRAMVRGQWAEGERLRKANPGLHVAIDTMPRVVADRLEDKLCAQPYQVSCRALIPQAAPMVTQDGMVQLPTEQKDEDERLRSAARARADKIEAQVVGLVRRMESQASTDLLRALSNGASRSGFAGPIRIGFDPKAPPDTLPLYFQVLDPRCYYEVSGSGAGNGPDLVIYKRMGTKTALRREGWQVDVDDPALRAGADQILTVYDCWERVKNGRETELWHAVFYEHRHGGQDVDGFSTPPVNLAPLGLLTIPYAVAPVRPDSSFDDDYPEGSSNALIDVLMPNWVNRNYLLSYQMQLVALAVNPPTIAATKSDIEVDVVTPGAEHQGDQGDTIEEIRSTAARPEVAQAWSMVESQTQRGTFSAASYGEGERSMSALMTGRLQSAGEEPISPTRTACQIVLSRFYSLTALFAKLFLEEDEHMVELQGGDMGFFDPSMLSGKEIFNIVIPAVSRAEAAQAAASARALCEPMSDGGRFVSAETARELSTLIQYEHQEEQRIRREMEEIILFEKVKAEHASGMEKINLQLQNVKAGMAVQQEMAKTQAEHERTRQVEMGGQQPPQPAQGPQMAPHGPNMPQRGPAPAPHNPAQPMAGVVPGGR